MFNRTFIGLIYLMTVSCTRSDTFIAEGIVPHTVFEGSKIYLVALDGPLSKKVDSTVIINNRFRFETKADPMGVRILRVPARFPDIIEDLVVITERGVVDVVLSSSSRGAGTYLNDLLQQWKNRKHVYDSTQADIRFRLNRENFSQEATDSIMRQSQELKSMFMKEVTDMMNENLENGIGLLLFKLYYRELPEFTRERILELTGDAYTGKDMELQRMVMHGK